jgi:hypothetical protein
MVRNLPEPPVSHARVLRAAVPGDGQPAHGSDQS